MHVLKQTELQQ